MTIKNLCTLPLATLLCAGLLTTACSDEDLDSSLTIQNDSAFAFIEINLSPTNAATWGTDLLGNDILAPGEAVEIGGIDCDDYDIRVVDEDADECIIDDVDLCLTDEVWVIDDLMLAACVAF